MSNMIDIIEIIFFSIDKIVRLQTFSYG